MLHVFGDSITKSVAFDDENGFRTVDDNFIRRAAAICGTPLRNRSLFGATIAKGRQMLTRFSGDLSPGDSILLAYGGNDCNFSWEQICEHPASEHSPRTPKEQFGRMLTESVEYLRGLGLHPLLMTLLPLQPKRFFNLISRNLSPGTILSWLGSIEAIYSWQEDYSRIVEEVAEKLQVPLFDARRIFLRHPHYEELLCSDGMHINALGQEALTNAFARFLKEQDL